MLSLFFVETFDKNGSVSKDTILATSMADAASTAAALGSSVRAPRVEFGITGKYRVILKAKEFQVN